VKDSNSPQQQAPGLKPSPATAAIANSAGALSAASMQPELTHMMLRTRPSLRRQRPEVAARSASWQAYTYVQDTLDRSGDREANDRIGVGAQKQINDRFRVGSEVSEGSGGFGGQLTADYRIDDRSECISGSFHRHGAR